MTTTSTAADRIAARVATASDTPADYANTPNGWNLHVIDKRLVDLRAADPTAAEWWENMRESEILGPDSHPDYPQRVLSFLGCLCEALAAAQG
jgi:hypothetical protein